MISKLSVLTVFVLLVPIANAQTVISFPVEKAEEIKLPSEKSLQGDLVQEFFRRPKFANLRISPNGRLVVAFENAGDAREIVVIDMLNKRKLKVLAEKPAALELNSLSWVDDENIVFSYESGSLALLGRIQLIFENEIATDVSVSVLGKEWYLVDPLPNLERRAVIVVYKDGVPFLYNIDIDSPDKTVNQLINKRLQYMVRKSYGWTFDADGRIRTAIEVDDKKLTKAVWYRSSDNSRWRAAWEGNIDDVFVPVLVHQDDRWLTVISNENSEFSVLTTYDRIDKVYGETIYQVPGSDIDSANVNMRKTRVVSVSTVQSGTTELHYLEDPTVAFPRLLDTQAYGSAPLVIGTSLDERNVIVRTTTNDNPGEYFLFLTDQNLSYRIGRRMPWIEKFRLGKTQVLRTRSIDDLEIESYLTLPDSTYENPPLIVMPHGGPISVRDTRDFNEAVQLLATLGYAVLQTNYRGSTGYGKSFESKGQQQWGRQIEDDIEAALRAVIDMNVIDEDKVCIFGMSYGGYSALISSVRSPEKYQCAASYAGVTDMTLIFHEFGVNFSKVIRDFFERTLGDPDEDMQSLIDHSPVFRAADITMPIFLAHGDKDPVVDIEHYFRMKKMLEHFGKNVTYMVLNGEAHGFEHMESRQHFYAELDRFFRTSLDLADPVPSTVLRDGKEWQRTTAVSKHSRTN